MVYLLYYKNINYKAIPLESIKLAGELNIELVEKVLFLKY
jgi:hypothetical protein